MILRYHIFAIVILAFIQPSFGQTADEILQQAETKAYKKDFKGADQ